MAQRHVDLLKERRNLPETHVRAQSRTVFILQGNRKGVIRFEVETALLKKAQETWVMRSYRDFIRDQFGIAAVIADQLNQI